MKLTILVTSILALFLIPCLGQKKSNTKFDKDKIVGNCSANRDSLYSRQVVLEQFADILNISIPEVETEYRFKFHVENEKAGAFIVYDLTNPANNNLVETKNCLEFIDNHIYHVVPRMHPLSFSHIIILENGNLKVFKSINCKDRGDTLENVVNYLNLKLDNDKNKSEIIERVKNFRKYGRYSRMDNFSTIQCQQY